MCAPAETQPICPSVCPSAFGLDLSEVWAPEDLCRVGCDVMQSGR